MDARRAHCHIGEVILSFTLLLTVFVRNVTFWMLRHEDQIVCLSPLEHLFNHPSQLKTFRYKKALLAKKTEELKQGHEEGPGQEEVPGDKEAEAAGDEVEPLSSSHNSHHQLSDDDEIIRQVYKYFIIDYSIFITNITITVD